MPGQDQEGVERRKGRPEVAQSKNAARDGEAEIAEGLAENHAAVFRARLRQHRVAVVSREVERAAIDDHAADRIAVAAEEFGGRVDDDIGAMLERPDQVGGRHRVVDDEREIVLLRDGRDGFEIDDHAARIGDRLDEDGLRPRRDCRLERRRIVGIRPATVQPKFLKEWLNWLIEPP